MQEHYTVIMSSLLPGRNLVEPGRISRKFRQFLLMPITFYSIIRLVSIRSAVFVCLSHRSVKYKLDDMKRKIVKTDLRITFSQIALKYKMNTVHEM